MKCPVCDENMRTIERSGIEVDICPGCKGMWLDRGELDKLLAIEGGAVQPTAADPAVSGQRQEEYRDERQRGDSGLSHDEDSRKERLGEGQRKRKGSWLSDILGSFGGGED